MDECTGHQYEAKAPRGKGILWNDYPSSKLTYGKSTIYNLSLTWNCRKRLRKKFEHGWAPSWTCWASKFLWCLPFLKKIYKHIKQTSNIKHLVVFFLNRPYFRSNNPIRSFHPPSRESHSNSRGRSRVPPAHCQHPWPGQVGCRTVKPATNNHDILNFNHQWFIMVTVHKPHGLVDRNMFTILWMVNQC